MGCAERRDYVGIRIEGTGKILLEVLTLRTKGHWLMVAIFAIYGKNLWSMSR